MNVRSAVVLAAGEGDRLRPLTTHRPKPMLPAAATPILERVFDELLDAGIERLIVVVGYGRNHIQTHFGDSYRTTPIEYVVQERQLGSGHALLAAEDALDDHTLVVNGDQLVDARILRDVIDAHDPAVDATLGVVGHHDVSAYGGVRVTDGEVTAFVERPPDGDRFLLNAGAYAIDRSVLAYLQEAASTAEHSLVDAFRRMLDDGVTVRGVRSDGLWIDATYPWDVLHVADALFEHDRVETDVAESARVHPSATLVDPVVVSADCVIGPGAVVGPNVSLGENGTIGANAAVEHSVVDVDTRVATTCTLVDCVTGRGVRIGHGSTIVGGPADVRVADRVHTDQRLGALLADYVHDEGGVTYAPGTVIGPNSHLGAGVTVSGTIDGETTVSR